MPKTELLVQYWEFCPQCRRAIYVEPEEAKDFTPRECSSCSTSGMEWSAKKTTGSAPKELQDDA